jgi:hypothetical protein
MLPAPPARSNILIKTDRADTILEIPQNGSAMRFLYGAFILFWLGGWAFGFKNALSKILDGEANSFIVFWLGAWSIGGAWVAFILYRIFRPTVPETLKFKPSSLVYDSGVPPFQMNAYSRTQSATWKSMFPSRTILELNGSDLRSLQLRPSDSSNRLTIDSGASRIDLAKSASEIEREWLYRVIATQYRIPMASKAE